VDREIAANVQRRTRLKQVATLVLPLVLLVGAIAWLPSWLRPTLSASRLRTAVVTAGPIDASISAAGLVVPAFERVLSSPLDARVLRILKRPGAVLAAGDAVLELDVSESAQALARAESDLKIKDNEQLRTRLGYEKSLVDLDGQMEVKTLEIQTRRATLDIHQQLAARGLLSQEELRKTALALRQAEVELAQLQNTRLSAGRTTDVQLEGLALERATLSRDVAERRRLLDLATTKSDRAGVLTWVVADEGVLVRRGDVIARIADLSAFRIDATVSDIHAGTIRTGLPVVIRIDERQFQGSVQEVYPTVENGAIRFMVAIDDAGDAALRPSLRADVQVITARRAETLKVQRGVFADGTGPRQVFVRNGNRAVRTTVELGVASFDEVEILSGLAPGDEVILTDMRDYEHLSEFRIR
jgi:HlyD family secretion protein